MEKTQQSSRNQIMPSIDRLSALPDEVLCHILSFLPTDLSVSTSILARRWRFLWAHVPNLDFEVGGPGRGELKIETICKVMSQYRVENMNAFHIHSNYLKCHGFQLETCIAEAIDRNVKELYIYGKVPERFPSCIFTCESVVDLHLTGRGHIPTTGDDVYLPALKKLFLGWVLYDSDESLPHLLSCCPVLEELRIHRLDPDVDCFIVSSRTINRLILKSGFVDHSNNGYTVKIDAPALRYLEMSDYMSKDVSVGSLAFLIEAKINYGDEDEDEDGDGDGDGDGDEDNDDDDDAPVEADGNHGFIDEAPMERDVLYALSVFKFVGNLCNVKYLCLSTHYMEVSDSVFATWTVRFHNLTKLELCGDSRFIPVFLENANNLEALTISTYNKHLKRWMEPKQVPTCLLSHLRTVEIDNFRFMDQEFCMVSYILRNSKVLERMEIHSESYGVDVKEKFEALKLISLFKRGSVECELAFH